MAVKLVQLHQKLQYSYQGYNYRQTKKGSKLYQRCDYQFFKYRYISHFLETAQTDFIETFESKIQTLARPYFHFQNGLNPSFMPTQQRPNRALTESSADQFYLIRQLHFQKLVLASQFLLARYFLRFNLICQIMNIYIYIEM
ncbi:Hypothetical_protein [Hexamita inflata]|uniref:Hypothetical_protein n=1 Tax=Hexamita inflata TaxID=28002 RepID=A0AA86TRZ3_9EUKA|nr:Hypothetical protein HINF_LOCUS14026 [Hexamita inflata]